MIELKLSVQSLQVIDRALQEMPYRLAAPVVDEINRQLKQSANQAESEEKTSPTQLAHTPTSL
jgi:hypothetical protein